MPIIFVQYESPYPWGWPCYGFHPPDKIATESEQFLWLNSQELSVSRDVNLCERCRWVNFSFLLGRVTSGFSHGSFRECKPLLYGSVAELKKRVECNFCRLVLRCIQSHPHLLNTTQAQNQPRDPEELNGFISSQSPQVANLGLILNSAFDMSIRVEIREITSVTSLTRFYLQRLHSAHSSPVLSMFGREVEGIMDFRTTSKWIRQCEVATDNLVWPGKIYGSAKPTAVRYIDVFRDCLVRTTTVPSYAALSYVWGQNNVSLKLTRKNERELHRTGALSVAASELSCTIHDAMVACKMLSTPFLWVDCLCILQDGKEKHSQIRNMHRIFHFAKVTLVAASGIDANAGLPGVSAGCREVRQLKTRVRDLFVGLKLDSLDAALWNTVWKSRAWTLQECLLSKRKLIFTDQQVYFSCTYGTCSEDFHEPIHQVKPAEQDELPSWEELHTFTPCQGLNLHTYDRIVQSYSSRMLSYEQDVLNAFEALSTAISRTIFCGISTIFGMPLCILDIAIL